MTLLRGFKRFRFTLASLFAVIGVVGLLFGSLCWNIEQVRQRNAALSWIKSHDGFASLYEDSLINYSGEPQRYWEEVSLPRVRLWLGDRPVYYIRLFPTGLTWNDRERIARLFPEAFVVPERPDAFKRVSKKGRKGSVENPHDYENHGVVGESDQVQVASLAVGVSTVGM